MLVRITIILVQILLIVIKILIIIRRRRIIITKVLSGIRTLSISVSWKKLKKAEKSAT